MASTREQQGDVLFGALGKRQRGSEQGPDEDSSVERDATDYINVTREAYVSDSVLLQICRNPDEFKVCSVGWKVHYILHLYQQNYGGVDVWMDMTFKLEFQGEVSDKNYMCQKAANFYALVPWKNWYGTPDSVAFQKYLPNAHGADDVALFYNALQEAWEDHKQAGMALAAATLNAKLEEESSHARVVYNKETSKWEVASSQWAGKPMYFVKK